MPIINLSDLEVIYKESKRTDESNIFDNYFKHTNDILNKKYYKYKNKYDDIKLAVLVSLFNIRSIYMENIIKENKKLYDIYKHFNNVYKFPIKDLVFLNYDTNNEIKFLFKQVINEDTNYNKTVITLDTRYNKIGFQNSITTSSNKLLIYNVNNNEVEKIKDFIDHFNEKNKIKQEAIITKITDYIKDVKTEKTNLEKKLKEKKEEQIKAEEEFKKIDEEYNKKDTEFIKIINDQELTKLSTELTDLNQELQNYKVKNYKLNATKQQLQQQLIYYTTFIYQTTDKKIIDANKRIIEDNKKSLNDQIKDTEKKIKDTEIKIKDTEIKIKDTEKKIEAEFKTKSDEQKKLTDEFISINNQKNKKQEEINKLKEEIQVFEYEISIILKKYYQKYNDKFNSIISEIDFINTNNQDDIINKYGYFLKFFLDIIIKTFYDDKDKDKDNITIFLTLINNHYNNKNKNQDELFIKYAKEYINSNSNDIKANDTLKILYEIENISNINIEYQIQFYKILIILIIYYNLIKQQQPLIQQQLTELLNIINTNFIIKENNSIWYFYTNTEIPKQDNVSIILTEIKAQIQQLQQIQQIQQIAQIQRLDDYYSILNFFNLSEITNDDYTTTNYTDATSYTQIRESINEKIQEYKKKKHEKIEEYKSKYGEEFINLISSIGMVIDHYIPPDNYKDLIKSDDSDSNYISFVLNLIVDLITRLENIKIFYEILSDETIITKAFKPVSVYISIDNKYYYNGTELKMDNSENKQLLIIDKYDTKPDIYRNIVNRYINMEPYPYNFNMDISTIFSKNGNLNLRSIIYKCNNKYVCVFEYKNEWILYNSHLYNMDELFTIKKDDIRKNLILFLPDADDYKIYPAIPISFIYT